MKKTLKMSLIDGDLDTSGHKLHITDTLVDFAVQNHRNRLGFVMGEWFLDLLRGLPYFQAILVKNPDIPLITSLFARTLAESPGTSVVTSVEIQQEGRTRIARMQYSAVLQDGTEILQEVLT